MESKEPKKIMVENNIYYEVKYDNAFMWKDIKHIQFEDNDILEISFEECYMKENNGMDGHYLAKITRMVEETDEQLKKRVDRNTRDNAWAKDRRRVNYISLKKEFENE